MKKIAQELKSFKT